jgi:hypothetical protein
MRALACCLFIVFLPECGGNPASGDGAKSAAQDARIDDAGAHARKAAARHDADEPSNRNDQPADEAKGPSCDDGTCSKCGSGICPTGWYCDEKVAGGGACSWLAECAEKPTCACVTRVLGSSCKCRAEDGGLKVACD